MLCHVFQHCYLLTHSLLPFSMSMSIYVYMYGFQTLFITGLVIYTNSKRGDAHNGLEILVTGTVCKSPYLYNNISNCTHIHIHTHQMPIHTYTCTYCTHSYEYTYINARIHTHAHNCSAIARCLCWHHHLRVC
ncbi:hypothetical protein EON63_04930 [archaeon]|nr:MAG: hypothetical protein EON63_04930 [archaeon]